MNIYYIYKITAPLQQMLKQYPNIKYKILSLQPKNKYLTNQMEVLFDTNDTVNEYLYQYFKDRSDYQRINNIHRINNVLTKESITCKVKDYCIEIEASKKSNIFYDILYQYSKRYVIMETQCMKQEV
jgi:hypothetical protein